jgi:predicted transcriptional regulator
MKKNGVYRISKNKQLWITIENKTRAKTILRALADDDKRSILMKLVNTPKPVNETLRSCKIPKTSGYRKINSLIKEGLITTKFFNHNDNNDAVTRYVSVFSDLKINFINNEPIVKILPYRNLKNNL